MILCNYPRSIDCAISLCRFAVHVVRLHISLVSFAYVSNAQLEPDSIVIRVVCKNDADLLNVFVADFCLLERNAHQISVFCFF